MEDLLTIQIIQILDTIVDNESENVKSPNVIEFKLGRSIHYQNTSIIPFIINEE